MPRAEPRPGFGKSGCAISSESQRDASRLHRRVLRRMLKQTVLPAVASLSISGALKVRLEQGCSGILIAVAALLVLSGQLVVVALVVLRAVMVHQVRVITSSLLRRSSQGATAGHPSRAGSHAGRDRMPPVSAPHKSKHRRDFS